MTHRWIYLMPAVLLWAGVAMAQPPEGRGPGAGIGVRAAERSGERLGKLMTQAGRDRDTSDSRSSMREFMQAEMTQVPALTNVWRGVQEVQQDRLILAREREEIARSSSGDTREQLRRFHDNLAREDALTSRLQDIAREASLVSDAAEKQILARRAELQKQLDSGSDDSTTKNSDPDSTGTTRNLRMAIRLYDVMLERLPALKENPGDAAAVQRLFGRTSWFSEDLDPILIGQAQRRLRQLEQEANDLRRRAEQLESQVTQMRELLEAASASGRRGGAGPPSGRGERAGKKP